jgi:hypothetical protein
LKNAQRLESVMVLLCAMAAVLPRGENADENSQSAFEVVREMTSQQIERYTCRRSLEETL